MAKKINPLDIDVYAYTEDQLCAIHDTLNKWDWPELFGREPDYWENMPRYSMRKHWFSPTTKSELMRPVMVKIERHVGAGKLLEYHWVHNLGKPAEEFRNWAIKRVIDHHFSCYTRMP